jgi:hypothetical protein
MPSNAVKRPIAIIIGQKRPETEVEASSAVMDENGAKDSIFCYYHARD